MSCVKQGWLGLLLWGQSSGLSGVGGCLQPTILLVPIFGLTQGTSWWVHISLWQDGFQHEGFWEVGKTILWAGGPFLLTPLPQIEDLLCSCIGLERPSQPKQSERKLWSPCLSPVQGLMLCMSLNSKCHQETGCRGSAWGFPLSYLMCPQGRKSKTSLCVSSSSKDTHPIRLEPHPYDLVLP